MTRFFLSEMRRRQLLTTLLQIGVPAQIAISLVFIEDDLVSVDATAAFLTERSIRWAAECGSCHDLHRIHELSTFLQADFSVLEAIRSEAIERGVNDTLNFPRWAAMAGGRGTLQ